MRKALKRTFEIGYPVDIEPSASNSIDALANAKGIDPFAYALECMLKDDGEALLMHPFENYHSGDLNVVEAMLRSPNTVCGVADAGAHVGIICDAGSPTSLLTHWGRDRQRGSKLPLEHLVHKQTQATARVYGMTDRGALAPGMRADINIIDFDELALTLPRVRHDLPAGGRRIVQFASGYRHTFVAGQEVSRNGELTGTRPGVLVRGN